LTVEDRRKKLQFAEKKVKEHTRKIRIASTLLKRWERRVAHQQREIAQIAAAVTADNVNAIWVNTPRGRKFRD